MGEDKAAWVEGYLQYVEHFESQLHEFVQTALEASDLIAAVECAALYSAKEVTTAELVGYQIGAGPEIAVASFTLLTAAAHHGRRRSESVLYRLVLSKRPPKPGTLDFKHFAVGKLAAAVLEGDADAKAKAAEFGTRYVDELERAITSGT